MHCLRGAGGVFDTACRWAKGGPLSSAENLTLTLGEGGLNAAKSGPSLPALTQEFPPSGQWSPRG